MMKSTTQDITGVGFQPDWTWIKEVSSTSGHVLADSNRHYLSIQQEKLMNGMF